MIMRIICNILILTVWSNGSSLFASQSQSDPPSYCGVYSLARAIRSHGHQISFEDLLQPKYITDRRRGSSAEDLVKAAKDFGMMASLQTNLNCLILQHIKCPTILHVKTNFRLKGSEHSSKYLHWILFAGIEGGKIKIYDGANDNPFFLEFSELAACWDGTGILIEKQETEQNWILFAYICYFLISAGISVCVLVTVHKVYLVFMIERFATHRCSLQLQLLAEICVVFSIAALFFGIYSFSNPGGFLAHQESIDRMQEANLGKFLPSMSANQLQDHLTQGNILVVDARPPEQFQKGHIPSSVNIPYYLSSEQASAALGEIEKAKIVTIYCEGQGCYFSDETARTLKKIGYTNLHLFREGWRGWLQFTRN